MSGKRLISLVRKRPWLFDNTHKDFKDNIKSFNSWQNIAKIMNAESMKTRSAPQYKTTWKNLMQKYRKLKRASKDKMRSGSRYVPTKRWVHMDAMDAFMKECCLHKRSSGNLESDVVEKMDDEIDVEGEQGRAEDVSGAHFTGDDDDNDTTTMTSEISSTPNESTPSRFTATTNKPSTSKTPSTSHPRRRKSKEDTTAMKSLLSSFEKSTDALTSMLPSKDEYGAWAEFAAVTLRRMEPTLARELMSRVTQMFLQPEAA